LANHKIVVLTDYPTLQCNKVMKPLEFGSLTNFAAILMAISIKIKL